MNIKKDQILGITLMILLILLTYLISSYALSLPQEVINSYGLLGIAVIGFLGTISIILPLPTDATVFFFSRIYSPLTLSITAGIASGIGEMTAYVLGMLGHKIIRKKELDLTRKNLEKYGYLFVFIASLTPLPYDVVGLAGGYLKLPVLPFLLATILGKILRYYLISTGGYLFFNNH